MVCYIDDTLLTGHTREEHLANLKAVLMRILGYGLRLKQSKCQFFLSHLDFLGHTISAQGVKPTKSKVKSVMEAPPLTTQQELQSFLGKLTYKCQIFAKCVSCPPSLESAIEEEYCMGMHRKT